MMRITQEKEPHIESNINMYKILLISLDDTGKIGCTFGWA